MRLLTVLTISAVLFLSACTTTVIPKNTTEAAVLRQVNVISVTNNTVNFDINDQFAWQTELMAAGSEAEAARDNIDKLQTQVKQDLNKRGYVVTEDLLKANYFLVGVVLLEGHESAAEHKELLLGLDPGMSPSNKYGLGTLLLGVRDAKNGDLIWRGAVQILLAGESADLSHEERKARIKHAIKMLVDGLFDYTK